MAASQRLDHLAQDLSFAPLLVLWATVHSPGERDGCKRLAGLVQSSRVDQKTVLRSIAGGFLIKVPADDLLWLIRTIRASAMDDGDEILNALYFWSIYHKSLNGPLSDLAWEVLESRGELPRRDAHHADHIAAVLATLNHDRAFALLERRLATAEESLHTWDPLDPNSGGPSFWEALRKIDPKRALGTVLRWASEQRKSFALWRLREHLNQEEDSDSLIEIAAEGEQQALAAAAVLTAGSAGFWKIALALVERYRDSERVKDQLESSLRREAVMVEAPYSERLTEWAQEVDQVLADPATPGAARPWLEQVRDRMLTDREAQRPRDEEEEWPRRGAAKDQPHTPERIAAIRILVLNDRMDEVRRVVPLQELFELLPRLRLPAPEVQRILGLLGEV